jgi:hypothetical protein
MYILGDAIIAQVTYMLDFMPVAVLMSRMCPKGMESTMYALLAGFSTFGQTVSRTVGFLLIGWMGINTSPPCDFSGLPYLVLLGHIVMPLAILPLCMVLVPNTPMKEEQVDHDAAEVMMTEVH